MKIIPLLFFVFFVSCNQPVKKTTLPEMLATGKWFDLSHDFSVNTVYWPNNPTGFRLDTQFNGMSPGGFYYSSNAFYAPEHGGTHLDAPVHFAKGKWSADQIPLQNLLGAALVIDVTDQCSKNADYQVTIADVEAWEKQYGKIQDDAILLFRTGWGKFYLDVAKYLGTAEKGQEATTKLHFPAIAPELADWLIKNRKIKAVGLDTPSIDFGQSTDFKSHQLFYAENIPGFENVANMDELPATGAFIFALPMKIKDGSGGPIRIIAWVENG